VKSFRWWFIVFPEKNGQYMGDSRSNLGQMHLAKAASFVKRFFLYVSRAAVVHFVFTYLLAMGLGIFFMLFTTEGSEFSQTSVENLPLGLLAIFVIRIPIAAPFGIVFVLTWLIYIICFALAWRMNEGFIQGLRGKTSQHPIFSSINFLLLFPALSSALWVLVLLMQGFQEAAGLPTGTIKFTNTYQGLFELAYSPVFEEVMFRISPYALYSAAATGAKLLARGTLKSSTILRSFFLSVAFPDRAKETSRPSIRKGGFRKGVSIGEWALVILTSTIFGLAHYLSGSGWEMGKITSSFMAGLVFFLSYLAFGFYAPILLHWFFNYYFYVYEVAAQSYHGIYETLENTVSVSVQAAGSFVLLAFSVYALLMKFSTAADTEHAYESPAATPRADP